MVGVFVALVFVSTEPAQGSQQIVAKALANSGIDLVADRKLDEAAECILNLSKSSGRLQSPAIRYCAQTAGVFDNLLLPAMVMHRGAKGLIEGLEPFLRGEVKKRGITHYGVALQIHEGWAHLLLLGTQRRGVLSVDPESQDPGSTLMFHGALNLSHEHPRALLSSPEGRVYSVPLSFLSTDQRTFVGQLRLPDSPGKYQLEIIGDSSQGPTVVCNRALFVGVPPPSPPADSVVEEGDPVARMLTLINASRAAHGLPSVALDGDLSAVAELHALAMRQASYVSSYFAHDSPDRSMTLPMRLWSAKIRYTEAAENLAESATVDDAHDTLMASPGHRESILNPGFSTVGIAVLPQKLSTGDRSVVVVVDFIRD